MFSRVQIEDAGDSEFVTGDVVSKLAVVEATRQLVKDGKLPLSTHSYYSHHQGSLSTDSFLMQPASRTLPRTHCRATSGKIDKLYGWRNVILGRRIPVGTGYGASNALDERQ